MSTLKYEQIFEFKVTAGQRIQIEYVRVLCYLLTLKDSIDPRRWKLISMGKLAEAWVLMITKV